MHLVAAPLSWVQVGACGYVCGGRHRLAGQSARTPLRPRGAGTHIVSVLSLRSHLTMYVYSVGGLTRQGHSVVPSVKNGMLLYLYCVHECGIFQEYV